MKLYVELDLADAVREHLRATAAGTEVWFADPQTRGPDDEKAFAEVEVALGNCDPSWVAKASRLRWLQLASVGVDAYRSFRWETVGTRLVVTNLRGTFAEPVAETCLAGLLALYRGIDKVVQLQHERRWETPVLRPQLRLLNRARVVVLGAGTIAQRFAELLAPYDCDVKLFGRRSGDIHSLTELDRLLPGADVVCCLLPDTDDTHDLFDARRLAMLQPGALFINAGRGTVVDEWALAEALRTGRLAGAVLDVTRDEPLPADNPLWNCPNTLLTQHTAGGSDDEGARVVAVFEDNWRRFQAGRPLRNVVDWTRGY